MEDIFFHVNGSQVDGCCFVSGSIYSVIPRTRETDNTRGDILYKEAIYKTGTRTVI
jgi:hypothetical protein